MSTIDIFDKKHLLDLGTLFQLFKKLKYFHKRESQQDLKT